MDDDLWWKVPSKRWFRSIFLRSSSSLRSSQCLMSHSFLWKTTSMEDDLWRKTTFDGRRPRMARLTFVSVCPFMLLQNNAFGLSLCKTTFDGRRPLMEDHLWWKTAFDGRWPLMEDDHLFVRWPLWMTTFDGGFLPNDGRAPSFWGRILIWGCPNVWRRTHLWKMTFMEDDLWWKTTFDGSPYFWECMSFQVTSK